MSAPAGSLIIDFVQGTSLFRERDRPSQFPIYRNGPPGTFVVFQHGLRVSLPTDQIVTADDSGGHVRVSFGGFAFAGFSEGRLTFHRVRELRPESGLSPERSQTMHLETQWVRSVSVADVQVWP